MASSADIAALSLSATGATSPRAASKSSGLFSLSGELRNKIYRYVLHKPDPVKVTINGFDRPALLATSKAIRSEALSIYYYENQFHVIIRAFDSTPALLWEAKQRSLGLKIQPMSPNFLYDMRTSWPNLMLWLKRYHALQIPCRPQRPEKGGLLLLDFMHHTVVGMFATVHALSEWTVGAVLPWELVEEIMLEQRPCLVAIDEDWGQD